MNQRMGVDHPDRLPGQALRRRTQRAGLRGQHRGNHRARVAHGGGLSRFSFDENGTVPFGGAPFLSSRCLSFRLEAWQERRDRLGTFGHCWMVRPERGIVQVRKMKATFVVHRMGAFRRCQAAGGWGPHRSDEVNYARSSTFPAAARRWMPRRAHCREKSASRVFRPPPVRHRQASSPTGPIGRIPSPAWATPAAAKLP